MRVPHWKLIVMCVFVCLGCEKKAPNRVDPPPPVPQLQPLIATIQDEVAKTESETDSYYRNEYRQQETLYWKKIAAWMVEDALDRQYPEAMPMSKILDLGCGFGTLLAFATTVYGVEGVCVDVMPFLWEKENVRRKYHLSYVKADIERDPLPGPEKFSVVILTEVLEHLNFHPLPTLKKIYDAMDDGGSFFLSTPDADAGWGRQLTYYQSLSDIPAVNNEAEWIDNHIWQYTRDELVGVMNEAGFKIKQIGHTQSGGGGHFNVWAVKE